MSQQVWFVTGCSSGFGEQFIKTIIERGDKAIATARRIESIKHLADLGAATLQFDATDSRKVMEEKIKEAWDIYGKIDVVVQNAGYGYITALEDMTDEGILKQFDTLAFGVVRLTQAITPYWRKQGSGHLVLVSSLASTTSIPCSGAYSGAKAAAEGFLRAYAAEVSPVGIKVLITQPGSYRTDIRNSSKWQKPKTEHFDQVYDGMLQFMHASHGTQPGDPQKFCEVTWDLVKETGAAQGKKVPVSLPLGEEAFKFENKRREKDVNELNEWGSMVRDTDYPGPHTGPDMADMSA